MQRISFLLGVIVKIFSAGLLYQQNKDGTYVQYPPLTVINNSDFPATVTYRGKTFVVPRYRTGEVNE